MGRSLAGQSHSTEYRDFREGGGGGGVLSNRVSREDKSTFPPPILNATPTIFLVDLVHSDLRPVALGLSCTKSTRSIGHMLLLLLLHRIH